MPLGQSDDELHVGMQDCTVHVPGAPRMLVPFGNARVHAPLPGHSSGTQVDIDAVPQSGDSEQSKALASVSAPPS